MILTRRAGEALRGNVNGISLEQNWLLSTTIHLERAQDFSNSCHTDTRSSRPSIEDKSIIAETIDITRAMCPPFKPNRGQTKVLDMLHLPHKTTHSTPTIGSQPQGGKIIVNPAPPPQSSLPASRETGGAQGRWGAPGNRRVPREGPIATRDWD